MSIDELNADFKFGKKTGKKSKLLKVKVKMKIF